MESTMLRDISQSEEASHHRTRVGSALHREAL
jgi:hypothetical protein